MMCRRLISIVAVWFISTLCVTMWADDMEIGKIHLSWNADKLSLYQHEPATLTLYLWTPEIDVRGVSQSKPGELDKGQFSYIRNVDFNSRGELVRKDDQNWYVYPVDSYVVALDGEGKRTLKGGRYYVDLAVPTLYDDPLWGRIQTMKTERVEVPVEPLTINVTKLPVAPDNSSFSGAVGNFKVDVTVPPGEIYLNEEALAIIRIKGDGWLADNILPEYREAFGEGTRLKSLSESRNQYVEDGKLVSELVLECTFIPTSRENAIIGPVRIEYFDTDAGKYKTAMSSSVKVKVESIAGKTPLHDI